jgi:hypothetical protein
MSEYIEKYTDSNSIFLIPSIEENRELTSYLDNYNMSYVIKLSGYDKNFNFAKTMNALMKKIENLEYKNIVLMNDDVILNYDFMNVIKSYKGNDVLIPLINGKKLGFSFTESKFKYFFMSIIENKLVRYPIKKMWEYRYIHKVVYTYNDRYGIPLVQPICVLPSFLLYFQNLFNEYYINGLEDNELSLQLISHGLKLKWISISVKHLNHVSFMKNNIENVENDINNRLQFTKYIHKNEELM